MCLQVGCFAERMKYVPLEQILSEAQLLPTNWSARSNISLALNCMLASLLMDSRGQTMWSKRSICLIGQSGLAAQTVTVTLTMALTTLTVYDCMRMGVS